MHNLGRTSFSLTVMTSRLWKIYISEYLLPRSISHLPPRVLVGADGEGEGRRRVRVENVRSSPPEASTVTKETQYEYHLQNEDPSLTHRRRIVEVLKT